MSWGAKVSNRSLIALLLLLLFFMMQPISKIFAVQSLILKGITLQREKNRTKEEQPNYPLQWIHPTKTGTSFANILFALACSDEVQFNVKHPSIPVDSYSVHVSRGIQRATDECRARWVDGALYPQRRKVRPAWWLGEHAYRNESIPLESIFITVREPVSRLLSYYTHVYWDEVQSSRDTRGLSEMMLNHADFGREMQAMTRMLNARYKMYTSSEISQGEGGQQACNNLNQVAWVGLTEHVNESICILHSKYKFENHPMETAHVRPAAHDTKQFNRTLLGEFIRMRWNITDDAMYKCARQRFERELLLYPHCRAII